MAGKRCKSGGSWFCAARWLTCVEESEPQISVWHSVCSFDFCQIRRPQGRPRVRESEVAMSRQIALRLRRVLAICLIEILATAVCAQLSQSAQKSSTEVHGQNLPSRTAITVKASIPFDFWIGPEKMPAGLYTLEVIVPSVAIIRSTDGKLEQELFTVDIGAPVPENESRLIFVTRNGKNMLSELWCIEGKRRLTAQSAESPKDRNLTTVVGLSYR
jgi:hypothetical protein